MAWRALVYGVVGELARTCTLYVVDDVASTGTLGGVRCGDVCGTMRLLTVQQLAGGIGSNDGLLVVVAQVGNESKNK
jgi:hypothetical protein